MSDPASSLAGFSFCLLGFVTIVTTLAAANEDRE
jgi:hypothetical protein